MAEYRVAVELEPSRPAHDKPMLERIIRDALIQELAIEPEVFVRVTVLETVRP